MIKSFSVAHSPDADDIFMYKAIDFGWIGSFKYEAKALDIESLNEAALKNIFDISAISFALYPLIAKEYALLNTAVSFGRGYGPRLIKLKNTKLKRNFKVALSGKNTTNALIFRLKYPDARIKYYNFLDIEKAVLNKEVDAGVLIHESILDFHKDLCVEAELWDLWCELAKSCLPLPLGGMALRRSLVLTDAIKIQEELLKAVSLAVNNQKILSKMLFQRELLRVDEANLAKYLSLYANKQSIKMQEEELKALDLLFKLGFEANFYDELIRAKDNLIPIKYKELRFS